ncbi:wax ester/triacylglycerol synthase domain-containing protein [Rhodococcus sp. B50]|uniref:wax ester/triacylglycerol synthase domain-containing protein n=1 Tax=Rhodococcus sp. B50 TaxID=2682847 RepID=UPI0027DC9075|nr:wax ester/triacylglycerol synthase domain-containing protein [Rhodococcus sp. B50]MBS9375090.1 putative diacylglycerol O-acyltransferase [Rhodococcus sp. B50]
MWDSSRIDRIGPGDLTELASDVGPVPLHVGAVIFFAGDGASDPATLRAAFAERLSGIRRLRQRLIEPAPGLGRPYWFDDDHFDIDAHLSQMRCPADADLDAAMALAVETLTRPLPRSRPLWRALLVTDIADPRGHTATVMVLHHVLADGIGGLAILAHLVDGADSAAPMYETPPPSTSPRTGELLVDNVIGRLHMLRRVPQAVARLPDAWAELGRGSGGRAPRCSFNAPTGTRRALRTVEVDLDTVRRTGRRWHATVNDVLLVAVSGALATVLHTRREFPSELVISVPVSARTAATRGQLGNRVGVMPVRVPLEGTAQQRLVSVSRRTRAQKSTIRGLSAALMGPLFRILAAVGAFHWFVNRQHLVNSFLSDLPGPSSPVSVAGAPVASIVPMIVSTGNIGVAFVALSYAGTLSVTITVDPDLVPEIDDLEDALHEQFHAVIASGEASAQ